MTWAPLRASPRGPVKNKVPQQQARTLPGGREANQDRAARIREAELRHLKRRAQANAEPEGVAQPEQAAKPRKRLAPPVPVAVVRTPFVMLLIMAVVAGVLGILVLNAKITENAFKLSALRKEQTALDLREQQLKQLISEHESPGSLAAAAAKLGLVESGPPAFILLPDGKIIGVPKPATGSPSITSQ
jgi:hypothetical protein